MEMADQVTKTVLNTTINDIAMSKPLHTNKLFKSRKANETLIPPINDLNVQ